MIRDSNQKISQPISVYPVRAILSGKCFDIVTNALKLSSLSAHFNLVKPSCWVGQVLTLPVEVLRFFRGRSWLQSLNAQLWCTRDAPICSFFIRFYVVNSSFLRFICFGFCLFLSENHRTSLGCIYSQRRSVKEVELGLALHLTVELGLALHLTSAKHNVQRRGWSSQNHVFSVQTVHRTF